MPCVYDAPRRSKVKLEKISLKRDFLNLSVVNLVILTN